MIWSNCDERKAPCRCQGRRVKDTQCNGAGFLMPSGRHCYHSPRAASRIFFLTSADRRCQRATSSLRGKSVQAVCRPEVGASTQLLCGETTCGIRDAGAIPAASTYHNASRFFIHNYVRCAVRGGFPPPPILWPHSLSNVALSDLDACALRPTGATHCKPRRRSEAAGEDYSSCCRRQAGARAWCFGRHRGIHRGAHRLVVAACLTVWVRMPDGLVKKLVSPP